MWRSSQILSLLKIVVGRRNGPYNDSIPGHRISSLVTKHFARLLKAESISQGEQTERSIRTSEVPVSAELGRCTADGAYLIVRCHAEQERHSILYAPKPENARVSDTKVGYQPEPYRPAFTTLILLDGGRFPNLVIILGHIEICARVQSMLDQHIVVPEF